MQRHKRKFITSLSLYRPDGQGSSKDKIKSEGKDFHSPLNSPKEGIQVADLPVDDSKDDLSTLVDSPDSDPSAIGEGSEFPKMSVYSPSQEQFSIPEDIGTEAQSSASLAASAVPEVQGAAKQYINDSEYPTAVSSASEQSFFSSSVSRAYSFSQPSIAPSPLMSPSTYHATFNPQTFPSPGTGADGMMTASAMYPNGACMSPSPYMSPYGTGKQFPWPTTPNAYSTFGMNSHDLMSNGYTSAYPSGSYSQMTTMSRSAYPTSYFPPQVTPTSHAS